MNWNIIWASVKNYVGIGLNTVKEAAKNVEVSPPDAPDLHSKASEHVTKPASKKKATSKKKD
jgi:hypothetical protein